MPRDRAVTLGVALAIALALALWDTRFHVVPTDDGAWRGMAECARMAGQMRPVAR